MPNWCYCSMEIESWSNNQLNKIDKILTGKTPRYNAIPDIDYANLFILDMVNSSLKNSEKFLMYGRSLETTFNVTCEEVIKKMYYLIKNNIVPYDLTFNNTINKKKRVDILLDYFTAYFKLQNMENEKDITKPYYESDYLNIDNLLPENPLSSYRKDNVIENGLVNDPNDIGICIAVDDWYSDRSFIRYGTKWLPKLLDKIFLNDNVLIYKLETAWGPCDLFAQILTEIFDVKVSIIYSEHGCELLGKKVYVDGELNQCIDLIPNNMLDWELLENELFMGDVTEGRATDGKTIIETIREISEYIVDDYATENDIDFDFGDYPDVLQYAKDNEEFLYYLIDLINNCNINERGKFQAINKLYRKCKPKMLETTSKINIKRIK